MRVLRWLLALPFLWLCGYLINASGLDSDLSWTLALDTEKGRIAAALAGKPRILLVGGSHTHYSVSAALVERMLGCRAVNLGLHGGLGLNAILARSLDRAARGDVVVLFPEYGLLNGDGTAWLTAAFGAAIGQPTMGGVGLEQKARILFRSGVTSLASLGKTAWIALGGERGRSEALSRVGDRGDTGVFFTDPRPGAWSVNGEVSEHAIRRLRQYRFEIEGRGARLVIALPWLYVPSASRAESLRGVARAVSRLEEVAPVVTHGTSYNLQSDVALFSDSNYHANEAGRTAHTAAMASWLKEIMEQRAWRCG